MLRSQKVQNALFNQFAASDNYEAEMDEAEAYLREYEARKRQMAEYMHQLYPDTPVQTWKMAISRPVQFTSTEKEAAFLAAKEQFKV